jgi:D-glycerate 3-kinase
LGLGNFEARLADMFTEQRQRDDYRDFVKQLWSRLSSSLSFPAIVGVTGAQGSGKTTLATMLVLWAREQGIAAAAVSLDDYYLSQQQRAVLAVTIHPLLAMRGMPGSHHIEQAIADAQAVLCGESIALPSFDKALDQPGSPCASQHIDMLIVEGWCLGLTPQSPEQLIGAINSLELTEDQCGHWRTFVNSQLATHYQVYWQLFSQLIWLKAPDWPAICRWRALQEQQLWLSRGKGMNDAELARFMQSFQRLTEHSFLLLPQLADVVVELDQRHRPQLI